MSEMPTLGRSASRSGHHLWRLLIVAIVLLGVVGVATWRWLVPARVPAPAPSEAAPPPAAEVPRKDGIRTAHIVITGPLETAYVTALGRELGTQLNQVV